MTVIKITDQSTRQEIAEALGWACQTAKRAPHVIEKFADEQPTVWTRCHRKLNELLDDLERAPE